MSIIKREGDFEYFLLIEIQAVATGRYYTVDGACYAQSPAEARQVAQNLGRDICHVNQQKGLDVTLVGYTVKPCLAVIYEEITNDKAD